MISMKPCARRCSSAPGASRIQLRGLSQGVGYGAALVGTYLDEQPITTIQGALDIHAYDLARVEALAGPQGTLYGASSQAGTIRIITNKPTTDGFEAAYNVEGNLVTAPAWPAHPAWLAKFLEVLGTKIVP